MNSYFHRMLLEFLWTQNITVLEEGGLPVQNNEGLECLLPACPHPESRRRECEEGMGSATYLSSSSNHKTAGAYPPSVRLEEWIKCAVPLASVKCYCCDGELQNSKWDKAIVPFFFFFFCVQGIKPRDSHILISKCSPISHIPNLHFLSLTLLFLGVPRGS